MISMINLPSHKYLIYIEQEKLYLGLQDREPGSPEKIIWMKKHDKTVHKFDMIHTNKDSFARILKICDDGSVGYLIKNNHLRIVQDIKFG
jgi:hypothetical protein